MRQAFQILSPPVRAISFEDGVQPVPAKLPEVNQGSEIQSAKQGKIMRKMNAVGPQPREPQNQLHADDSVRFLVDPELPRGSAGTAIQCLPIVLWISNLVDAPGTSEEFPIEG